MRELIRPDLLLLDDFAMRQLTVPDGSEAAGRGRGDRGGSLTMSARRFRPCGRSELLAAARVIA
ncbi:hypothetical protein [Streptomyces sp. NPDC001135]